MRAALLALLVVLAGCSGAPAATESSSSSSSASSSMGPVGGNASELAPTWQVGQSWTWRVTGPPGMTPLEATTAVVSADGASYQIGSPDPEAAALVFPFHLIGLGEVDKKTLAWDAHGTPVRLLRFPFKDNDTWTADFWGVQGAQVSSAKGFIRDPDAGLTEGYSILVQYPNNGGIFLTAEWSPLRGQFTTVETFFGSSTPFASASLKGQGTSSEAKPFIPTELLRISASAASPGNLVAQSFTVPADADLVLLACFLGGGQGHFQATMLLADQQQASCQVTSPSGGALEYHAATLAAGAGPGNLAAAPVGAGGVTVEVFSIRTA